MLGKFPPDVKPGRWEAETRGGSVTIFSSEMNFKTQSLQRLHEQLRHEIFHFWFPNGVSLSGNYDWFYEGFALYASLKTAVAMNKIRFEDFLDTLSRAHSIDSLQSQKVSLVEASKNRWNGMNTQIYARGMLAAFLIDLALLQKSKGKSSLSEILREIYQKHNFSAPRQDGNAAIQGVLQARAELRPIVDKYIKGTENIAWQTDLDAFGIESATENFTTKLKVKDGLNGRQKDLLSKLGYNNWRK
jgi:predicted metalloprotease with PDZ domain